MQDRVGQPHVHGGPHGGHEGKVVQSLVPLAVVKCVKEAAVPTVGDVLGNFHIATQLNP